jgi:hypothetical protein
MNISCFLVGPTTGPVPSRPYFLRPGFGIVELTNSLEHKARHVKTGVFSTILPAEMRGIPPARRIFTHPPRAILTFAAPSATIIAQ